VITSTLLTLVVVPVIYAYLATWSDRRSRRRATRHAAVATAGDD
jgi:antibiotic biosynthesis monooxygenase (ABM) superfamily enzyme